VRLEIITVDKYIPKEVEVDFTAALRSVNTPNERKPYVTPAYKRFTSEEAMDLLLLQDNVNDPEVDRMLDCIADLNTLDTLL